MPAFSGASRAELRQVWVTAWRKAREGLPLEPLEAVLAEVLEIHPEYHRYVAPDEDNLDRDWGPEGGETNPFLHMGLHVALREAVSTDRPAGLRAAFLKVAARLSDSHEAEHRLIDCLAETLWEAQRAGLPPDEAAFLARAQRLAGER